MWLHYGLACWVVGVTVVLLVLYAYGEQETRRGKDGDEGEEI